MNNTRNDTNKNTNLRERIRVLSRSFSRRFAFISKKVGFFSSAIIVAIAGIFIYAWINSKPAQASWMDENWLYRAPIAVSNSSGSNQTDFQVSFTLDTATLIAAGKMQSTCSDLRTTDISGKLLPQWIEENNPGCNSATTKVWTKVPSIPTSGATIYIYYGNPSAASIDDGGKVFTFFDNFNSSSVNVTKWSTTGSPSISSNALSISNSAGLVSKSTISSASNNQTVGFRAKANTNATTLSAARLGFSDNNNLSTGYASADSAHVLIGNEQTYQTAISGSNLVSYHQLEETTSTDANQFKGSGYLDTGKLSQAVSMYGNAAGTTGSTLTFNRGANISTNNYEHLNTNQGSLSFWVKPSWNGNDGVKHVLFDGNINSPTNSFLVFKETNNYLYFRVNSGNDRYIGASISSWTAGSWYHILATWDKDQATNTLKLYANGSSIGTLNEAINIGYTGSSTYSNLYIGSDKSGQNQAQALIDDFAIWDRVLSSTEIAALYNSGTGAKAETYADHDLKFYAKMDGSGTLSPVTYNGGYNVDQKAYNSSTNTNGNMVTNGNMEAASSGLATSWTNSGATVADSESTNIFADTRSQKVTSPFGGSGIYQAVNVTANAEYVFSAWVKGEGRVGLWDGNSSSTRLVDQDFNYASWTLFQSVIKPTQTTVGILFINNGGQPGDSVYYVDNVSLTPNLVANGGLDSVTGTADDGISDDFTSWSENTNSELVETTTTVHSSKVAGGTRAVKLTTSNSSNWPNISQSGITVTANNYYLLSFYTRGDGTNQGQYMVRNSADNAFIINYTGTGVSGTSYQKVSAIFKAPSNATTIEVAMISANASSSTVYFDDISLIPLDNTALSFQSWAPVTDTTSANNSLSVQGDSDGVTSTTSGAHSNAYTFDGSTGYLRQKTYATNIGTLSYSGNTFADDGQTFTSYKTSSGNAAYMIVITNSDNTTSAGYIGNNSENSNTVTVYTTKARTTVGWFTGGGGTSPTGKTPVGYEIRKTDFQITNALTVGAWVKARDTIARFIISKTLNNGTGYYLYGGNTPTFAIRKASNGSYVEVSSSTTMSTGAWHFVVASFDGTNLKIYLDGTNTGTTTISADTIRDSLEPLGIGKEIDYNSSLWYGSIDSPFVTSSALTADQVNALYTAQVNYGLANSYSGSYGFGAAATALDTNYHTFEISQTASSAIYSVDGGSAITSTTNPPTTNQYIRLENSDASNATLIDYVYARKYVASAPTAGSAGTEEQSPGPVGYWKFDDGQGTTVNDASPNKNSGALGGTIIPTWQPEDRCVAGKCLFFDGSTSKVTGSKIANGIQTVSFWIRPNTIATQGLFNLDGGTHKVSTNTSGVISATGFTSPTYYINGVATATPTLTLNQWNHVSITTAAGFNSTNSFTIGADGTNFIKGFIDEVKFYPYTRTTAQIKADYLAGKANAQAHAGISAVLGSQTQDYLSNGLVGYWKMDDNVSGDSKSLTDSSGNSNTATTHYGANATGMDCTVTGKFGGGCNWDGVDDYVTVANSTPLAIATNRITIALWVKWLGATSDVNGRLISKEGASSGYTTWINNDRTVSWRWGGTGANGNTTSTVGNGTWTHVVYTYDGTNTRVYLNGALDYTVQEASVPDFSAANTLYLGEYTTGTHRRLNGSMDDVRIYNRSFSPKEVSDLYNWAPGPVGYWAMDDKVDGDSKTIVDKSGSGNNGSTVDGANNTGMSCTKNGKYGGACQFDGTDDYIGAGNPATFQLTTTLTVEAWVKGSAFLADGHKSVVGKSTAFTTNGYGISIYNSEPRFYAGTNQAIGTSTLSTNAWYHIAGTYDKSLSSNNIKIYVNGVLEAQQTQTSGITDASANFQIGMVYSGVNFFNGVIDDVKVYNYARTQKQIVSDMNADHPNVGSPVGSPSINLDFDEGYGSTANNSGNGGSAKNGTVNSGTWTDSGKFGKGVTLNGSSGSNVSIPDFAY